MSSDQGQVLRYNCRLMEKCGNY